MKLVAILKNILFIAALVFIFIDWKVSIALFLASTIFHVIPMGPNALLSVITGYLMIGGVVSFFINWKLAVVLIISSGIVARFRVWANRVNYEYYCENKEQSGVES